MPYADPIKAKACQREYDRAYRAKNRDRLNARDRARREKRRILEGRPKRQRTPAEEIRRRRRARDKARDADKTSVKGRIRHMFHNARARARERGREFTLRVQDISVPERCPILGIPLGTARDTPLDNRYSLDRIDSTKGYAKDNVQIISFRANTLKSNMTIDECRALLAYMEGHAALAEICY